MITMNSQGEGELGGINPAMKRHLDLEIETLQNAPRDAYIGWRSFEKKGKRKIRTRLHHFITYRLN